MIAIIILMLIANATSLPPYGRRQAQEFDITCEENCHAESNSNRASETKLKITCGGASCLQAWQFEWTLEPQPPDLEWRKDVKVDPGSHGILIKPWVIPPGNVTLTATATRSGSTKNVTLTFVELTNSFTIECTAENCKTVDITDEASFRITCVTDCKNANFVWKLYPPAAYEILTEYPDQKRLIIHPGAYDREHNVTVSVHDRDRRQWFHMQFVVTKTQLLIQCKNDNCYEYLWDRPIELMAYCNRSCTSGHIKWDVTPQKEEIYVTGIRNETLTIPANTYLGGVSVLIVASQNNGSSSRAFRVKGSCEISPQIGEADFTIFSIQCEYTRNTSIDVFQVGPDESLTKVYHGPFLFSRFALGEGDPANVMVNILPSGPIFNMSVKVFKENVGETDADKIKDLIMAHSNLYLDHYNHTNHGVFTNLAIKLLTIVDKLSDIGFKNKYRRHILEHVVAATDHLAPTLSLSLLEKTKQIGINPDEDIIAEALRRTTSKLSAISNEYEADNLTDTVRRLLSIANAVVNKSCVQDITHLPKFSIPRTRELTKWRMASFELLKFWRNTRGLRDNNGVELPKVEADRSTNLHRRECQRRVHMAVLGDGTFVSVSRELSNELKFEKAECFVAVLKVHPLLWQRNISENYSDTLMMKIYGKSGELKSLRNGIDFYFKLNSTSSTVIEGDITDDFVNVHRLDLKKGTRIYVTFQTFEDLYRALITHSFPDLEDVREKGQRMHLQAKNELQFELAQDIVYVAVSRDVGHRETAYSIKVTAIQCLSWHGGTWDWDMEGCEVMPDSDENYTHCRCNRLSLFATSFVVVPNRLDYITKISFTEAIMRSSLVVGAVGVILLIWAMLMVWAARTDSRLSKSGFKVLSDNVPGDNYTYFVEVVTGPWQDAGTSANVALQLEGRGTKSRVHLLKGPGLLNQGDETVYVLYSPEYLGKLQSIRLFHDSYGSRPHWYCERVTVHYLAKKERYVFIVEKWFSAIYSDGQVSRQIHLASKKQVQQPKALFSQTAQNELKEHNLWMSAISRSAYSTFTSKERITVATSILLLSMVTSAMFYGVVDEDEMDRGAYIFSTTDLMIILESLLITIPINVVITVLFRKSLPARQMFVFKK